MSRVPELSSEVRSLPLSRRAINCLINSKIVTLEQLRRNFGPHFLKLRALGRKTYREIETFLSTLPEVNPPPSHASSTQISSTRSDILDTLYQFLESLPVRERHILCSRRGLLISPFETLEALGARHRITRERVRQIEQKLVDKLIARVKYLNGEVLSKTNAILMAEQLVTTDGLAGRLFSSPAPEHAKILNMALESTGVQLMTMRLDTNLWGIKNQITERYNDIVSLAKDLIIQIGDDLDQLSIEIGRRLNLRSAGDISLIRKVLQLSPEYRSDGNALRVADEGSVSMATQRRNYAYEYIRDEGVPVNVREVLYKLRTGRPELLENIGSNVLEVLRGNLERDRRLAWAGPSFFALVEWGYDHSIRSIGDAAYDLLRVRNQPFKLGDIESRILKMHRVNRGSINVALRAEEGSRFVRVGKGLWRAS